MTKHKDNENTNTYNTLTNKESYWDELPLVPLLRGAGAARSLPRIGRL